MITEHIMERIATALNKDPVEVRQVNYYKNGDVRATVLIMCYSIY